MQKKGNTTYIKIGEEHFIEALLADLNTRNIQSLIIEGGSFLLRSLIDLKLWDEARIFTSKITFEEGIEAPKVKGTLKSEQELMGDTIKIIRNRQSK